ncbi:hypothetical protein [Enterocloster bolteae]|uniref:hypothetical protein n=1 Tax=Enterocloster bolteae TaxID=208479 RepID=UPI002A7FC314|nr:hypothetical protein [Enterocloster bolteae]
MPKPLFPEALQLEQTIYRLCRTPFYPMTAILPDGRYFARWPLFCPMTPFCPMTEKRVLQAKAVFTVSAPQHRLYHPELPDCLF